ncbi:MAG: hypothetical protein IT361_10420 [Gemmatimonadaceae bacterium]|nr:hypothetical protein [Gemmatimonadaceae bacterium]
MTDLKTGFQEATLSDERDRRDAMLLARIAAGDERALGSLYDAYGAVLYGLAVAITRSADVAETVVADAFGAVWREARSFDPHRRSAFVWISAMVRSLALAARRQAVPVVEPSLPTLSGDSFVGSALASLTGTQRTAVELAYFGGLRIADIATRLGESEAAAGQYLRTAMDALRHALAPASAHTPVADSAPRQVAGS